jgi:DNA repair protein RadC
MNQSNFHFASQVRSNRTLVVSEQPQTRLENFGVKALSDTELLATVLQGAGTSPEQAISMAANLMTEARSLPAISSWLPSDFRRIKGIGKCRGLQLTAVAEIARRMTATSTSAPLLNKAELVAVHMAHAVAGLQVEKFWVLCLTRKNRLLKQVEVTSGTATAALVHPREVFRAAVREAAVAIICVHNHPSGDPAPSGPDINVTRQLREAAKIVDIELIDHVIVGQAEFDPLSRGYFSFREAGLL